MNEHKITPSGDLDVVSTALLDAYKTFLQTPEYNEIYKWEIAKTVQDNWDLEAKDLAGMIDKSFAHKSTNLWSGRNYFPKTMLLEWAVADKEDLRNALRALLYGTASLANRMRDFENAAKVFIEGYKPDKSMFQGMRAAALWLGMVLPEEHYLFKSKMADNFCKITDHEPLAKLGDKYTRITSYYQLCEEVRQVLVSRPDVIEAHKAIRNSNCHPDLQHHLLVQDFIYYVAERIKKPQARIVVIEEEAILFKKVVDAVGDDAAYFLDNVSDVLAELGVGPKDDRVTFSCPNSKRAALTIGQRYCLELKVGKLERFGFITQKKGNEPDVDYGHYGSDESVAFGSTANRVRVEENKAGWHSACAAELERTKTSGFRQHSNSAFERAVFDLEYRAQLLRQPIGVIMVNVTWNSNDWKGPSDDKSNHKWVQAGNVPHESWNFDFDNVRNTPKKVYAYSQRVVEPKLEGSNNLVIFHSQGKVVGFYGRAEVLREKVPVTEGQDYNIIGDRSLSFVLENKLDDIKAKGYIEDKKRMGQNGFIYLKDPETALKMIDEAIDLNPNKKLELEALRTWYTSGKHDTQENNKTNNMSIPLNRIYYGPPGTGKTHHTINAAVEVCDPVFYARHATDRTKIRERYEALRVKDWRNVQGPGQIGFATFHQSFSYEDFVEGIKPMKPVDGDAYLKYEVRPGILKQMVQRAEFYASGEAAKVKRQLGFTEAEAVKAEFYKMSLGDSQNSEDQMIYDYCIENNVIAIGFLGQHDLTGLTEQQVRALPLTATQSKYDHTAMSIFTHYLKEGNYVMVTFGNFVVRAIGRVTGEYYYDPKSEIGYPHFRKVNWLAINEAIPWVEIYARQFSQQTIYKLKKEDINREFFVTDSSTATTEESEKNFVLIIDEINRGNVAGIFGELITLIEDNKRKGKGKLETLEVTLPYSQEPFSIPDNLYIIGTMNTADRSVESLDAALRRRFSFEPMMPDTTNLKRLKNSKVDIHKMLDKINERLVQLLDEDHQIGHSHFWELHNEVDPIPALRRVFADKIIPQLEEYFHRDRSKLQLVLGPDFVSRTEIASDLFLGDGEQEMEPRPIYKITKQALWTEDAFRSIHG